MMNENGRGGILPLDKWTRKPRRSVNVSLRMSTKMRQGMVSGHRLDEPRRGVNHGVPLGGRDVSIESRSFSLLVDHTSCRGSERQSCNPGLSFPQPCGVSILGSR